MPQCMTARGLFQNIPNHARLRVMYITLRGVGNIEIDGWLSEMGYLREGVYLLFITES